MLHSKTFLLISTFLDRILGLIGMLTILGIVSLVNYQELISKSPAIEKMLHFNFLLFIG